LLARLCAYFQEDLQPVVESGSGMGNVVIALALKVAARPVVVCDRIAAIAMLQAHRDEPTQGKPLEA
jgi:hypothetical protein